MPRMIMEYTMNLKSIHPKQMTEIAIAAMKSREPEVNNCPRRNIKLVDFFAVAPNLFPM